MTVLLGADAGGLFPAVDPIPLPAPVWLFKILHNLTLALHFGAVHFLLGGLLIALLTNWLGRRSRRADLIETSGGAGRLAAGNHDLRDQPRSPALALCPAFMAGLCTPAAY